MNKYLRFFSISIFTLCGCTTSPPPSSFPIIQGDSNPRIIITPAPSAQEKQIRKKPNRPNTRYYRYKLKQKCLKKDYQTEKELNFCIKKLMDSNG